jgi:hypothetical protein
VNGHSSPGQMLQATDAWLPRGERHSPPACCTWFVSAHRSQTLNINSEIERTLHEVQISDNDVCEGRLRTVLACISGCILLAPASPANGGQEVFRPSLINPREMQYGRVSLGADQQIASLWCLARAAMENR